MPASAKLQGITPSFSEEGKCTEVLQSPGSHYVRTASNTALTSGLVFPIALGSHPSPSKLPNCESHSVIWHRDMSFKRKVLHLKFCNLAPLGWHITCLFCSILLTPSLSGCWVFCASCICYARELLTPVLPHAPWKHSSGAENSPLLRTGLVTWTWKVHKKHINDFAQTAHFSLHSTNFLQGEQTQTYHLCLIHTSFLHLGHSVTHDPKDQPGLPQMDVDAT